MKIESLTTDSRNSECFKAAGALQARRYRNTTSPFFRLLERKARRTSRIGLPPVPARPLDRTHRELLANLRAAELAAWEASGGDFLRSARPK
jgi:hypothetical protein